MWPITAQLCGHIELIMMKAWIYACTVSLSIYVVIFVSDHFEIYFELFCFVSGVTEHRTLEQKSFTY